MSSAALARWQRILQHQAGGLQAQPVASQPPPTELSARFLYSGQTHDSVPRHLLLDNRLTPLERNAWQVIRLLTRDPGACSPRYEDLRVHLSNVPYGAAASRETIARVLTQLRLTRWLSLVARNRHPVTGRLQGSLYVLHDAPLTPAEALELDPDYLELVGNSLRHASKAVRIVAEHAVDDIRQDTNIDQACLPSRLEIMAQRCAAEAEASLQTELPFSESEPSAQTQVRIPTAPSSASEPGQIALVRNRASPGSDSEPCLKSITYHRVRNPNAIRTVLNTNTSTGIKTIPRGQAREENPLTVAWPAVLNLDHAQRQAVQHALAKLQPDDRQAVLAEAQARSTGGTVRNPVRLPDGPCATGAAGRFSPLGRHAINPACAAGHAEPIHAHQPAPAAGRSDFQSGAGLSGRAAQTGSQPRGTRQRRKLTRYASGIGRETCFDLCHWHRFGKHASNYATGIGLGSTARSYATGIGLETRLELCHWHRSGKHASSYATGIDRGTRLEAMPLA